MQIEIPIYVNSEPQWWKNFVAKNEPLSPVKLSKEWGIGIGKHRKYSPYSLVFKSEQEYVMFVLRWI